MFNPTILHYFAVGIIRVLAPQGNSCRFTIRTFAFITAAFISVSYNFSTAQSSSKHIPRVGLIAGTGTPTAPSRLFDAFRSGMREHGYVEGNNIIFERRFANGRLDHIPLLVNELVHQNIDILLATSNVAIKAAKQATQSIPIVMITTIDPIAAGYVTSFAHPGGNITGLATLNSQISAKRLELLKELLPLASRIGVLWNTDAPGPAVAFKEYAAAVKPFRLGLFSLEVHGPTPDYAQAFRKAKIERVEAIILIMSPVMAQHSKQVLALAISNRMPTIVEESRYIGAGGLISYGANFADLYRRSAAYVDDILKGAKPSDLPVRTATKFEILVNLKTADEIGVDVPQRVLIRADKIIK